MNLVEARVLYLNGAIHKFTIKRFGPNDWGINVHYGLEGRVVEAIQTARMEERRFSSLDTVHRAIDSVIQDREWQMEVVLKGNIVEQAKTPAHAEPRRVRALDQYDREYQD